MMLMFVFYSVLGVVQGADDGAIWHKEAQQELIKSLNMKHNHNIAKNVILFLGDGMGVSTVSAARLYKAQLTKVTEGQNTLVFDDFPYVALSKTYNTDKQTPDSAGTATAFLCGVKANSGTLGVNSLVPRGDCLKEKGNEVQSILNWSQTEGKSVGIVTTSRITHATPAGTYAHSADRNWESDASMINVTGNCPDIAKQLIRDNPDIEVIMGGGRSNFLPESKGGVRKDNVNLIEEWEVDKGNKRRNGTFIKTKTELDAIDPSKTDNLLGLFANSHLDYEIDRERNNDEDQPSIANMTKVAIDILKKNPKGFFLLVEGARIDHGHHLNQALRALHDTLAFDDAVRTALTTLGTEETLVVVTADHSHVFGMAGYPDTGNPILGLVNPVDEYQKPLDDLPYTALVYGNGPGALLENKTNGEYGQQRRNLTGVNTQSDPDFQFHSAVRLRSETHAAEDVGIFAIGPMSHLFHGVHEQNYIAHVMAYASCVGSNKNHCVEKKPPPVHDCNSASDKRKTIVSFTFCILVLFRCLLE